MKQCGRGGMADTLVIGANAQACKFKSCRPHQRIETRMFYRLAKHSGLLFIIKTFT